MVPVDRSAWHPPAGVPGESGAYTWFLRCEGFVIAELGFGIRVWVDDEVLECVPHHALLAQVWWGAVARKGARRREEAEDLELLLRSRWKARDGNYVVELLARYFEKYGAGAVEEVDDAEH